MKKIASLTVLSIAATIAAPAVQAGAADELHRKHQSIGAIANESGRQAVQAAKKAAEPVIYAGKAIINGVEFVILKTVEGTVMVAEGAVRGLQFAYEGAKFVALKTKEGIVWVAEKAIRAGEILADAALELAEMTIDGIVYVAARLEEGIVFVAKKTWEAAKKTGELVVKGAKFVAKKTKQGLGFVANTAKSAARAARRGALVVELRTNLATALSTGGVGPRTMAYFQRRSQDRDATVARLAKACLAAGEAFNSVY